MEVPIERKNCCLERCPLVERRPTRIRTVATRRISTLCSTAGNAPMFVATQGAVLVPLRPCASSSPSRRSSCTRRCIAPGSWPRRIPCTGVVPFHRYDFLPLAASRLIRSRAVMAFRWALGGAKGPGKFAEYSAAHATAPHQCNRSHELDPWKEM